MTDSAPTTPSITHHTPSELAHALRDYARPDFGANISLRPYNRFRPNDTYWWLCPDSDDPAYHYGKFISKTAEQSDNLFVGICFEKGIGTTAAPFFETTRVGKSWIVRSNWIWNGFFNSLSEGAFDSYCDNAQSIGDVPVTVIVSAGMMDPPEPGKREDAVYEMLASLPRQHIYYSFDSSRLSLMHDHSDSDTIIRGASECRTLADIATKIKTIEKVDWIWVNVEFGFLLAKDAGPGPVWHTDSIWSNACEPFLDWFR